MWIRLFKTIFFLSLFQNELLATHLLHNQLLSPLMSVLHTEMCYSKGYWPRVRSDPCTMGTAITHKMRARLSPALICTTMDVQKPPSVTGDLLWTPPWVQPRSKWGEVAISGYSRTRTGSGWAGKTHKTLTQSYLFPNQAGCNSGDMSDTVFWEHVSFSSCLCCMVGPHFWSHVCTELCTTGILFKVALRTPRKETITAKLSPYHINHFCTYHISVQHSSL